MGTPAKKAKELPAALAASAAKYATQGVAKEATDFQIPYLTLIQDKSSWVTEGEDRYSKDNEPGMIANTVTEETWAGDKGVSVIPVYYRKVYVERERTRRRNRGPIVERHFGAKGKKLWDTARRDNGEFVLKNGNVIVDTAEHYVLINKGDGNFSRAVISMVSTQLKHSRGWNSQIAEHPINDMVIPFTQQYTLKTRTEKNDEGTWKGWSIKFDKMLTDDETALKSAATFHDAISAGDVEVVGEEEVEVENEHI